MRRLINEFLWTGKSFDADELVSLKDILEKEDSDTFQDQPEEYIMLTNIVDETSTGESGGKDLRLLVRRTKIDFNKQNCKLVSFTDISDLKKVKSWQKTTQLLQV